MSTQWAHLYKATHFVSGADRQPGPFNIESIKFSRADNARERVDVNDYKKKINEMLKIYSGEGGRELCVPGSLLARMLKIYAAGSSASGQRGRTVTLNSPAVPALRRIIPA